MKMSAKSLRKITQKYWKIKRCAFTWAPRRGAPEATKFFKNVFEKPIEARNF